MKGKQFGFTLVELVMVIVILGILAVVALPRMMTGYEEAHDSSITATGGALASAVILLRGQWVSNGAKGEVDGVLGYGDDDIATSADGWPSDAQQGGGSNHNEVVAGDAPRCVRLWQSLLITSAPRVATTLADDIEYQALAPGGSICRYVYKMNDENSQIEYNLQTGSVVTIL